MTQTEIARILHQAKPVVESYPTQGEEGGLDSLSTSYSEHDYKIALGEWNNMVSLFAYAMSKYPSFNRNTFMVRCQYGMGENAQ